MPEPQLENRPKERVVATDVGLKPCLRPMSSDMRLTSAISTRLFMGLDGVSMKIKAIRPPVMARSTAARMFASSNPSVKPTPFVQRHPSNGRSLFAASHHCARGSRLGFGSFRGGHGRIYRDAASAKRRPRQLSRRDVNAKSVLDDQRDIRHGSTINVLAPPKPTPKPDKRAKVIIALCRR